MKEETKDGTILDIKDMDNNHIGNCIRQYKRILSSKPSDYGDPSDSDGAFFAQKCENDYNNELEEHIEEVIKTLEEELKSRF